MSKESFDLDALEEMENEFVDLSESERQVKTKKKKEEAEKKKQNKRSVSNILLTSVLPTVVAGGLCFFAGSLLTPTQSSSVTTIKQIKNESSLSSRVNSIKDSELLALQSQLKTVTQSFEDSSMGTTEIVINNLISDDSVLIEQFMTELLNDDGSDNRSNLRARLQTFFLDESSETTDASKLKQKDEATVQKETNFEEVLNSTSLARALSTSTSKAGLSFVSIMSGTPHSTRLYQVVSPIATKDGQIHNVIYFVKTDGRKIVSSSYGGKIDGLESSSQYFEALANSIKEINDIEVGDSSTSLTGLTQGSGTSDADSETTSSETTESETTESTESTDDQE